MNYKTTINLNIDSKKSEASQQDKSTIDEVVDIIMEISSDQENPQLYNEIYDRLATYDDNIDEMLVNTNFMEILLDTLNYEDLNLQFSCFRLIALIAAKTKIVMQELFENIDNLLEYIANPDFLVETCKIIQAITLSDEETADMLIKNYNILSIISSCVSRTKGTIRHTFLFRSLYLILDRASKECLQSENEEGIIYETIPVDPIEKLFFTDKPELLEYILLSANVLIKKTNRSIRDFFPDSFYEHLVSIVSEVFSNPKYEKCQIPLTKILQKFVDYSILSDNQHALRAIDNIVDVLGKNSQTDRNLLSIIQSVHDIDFFMRYLLDSRIFERLIKMWLDNFDSFAKESLLPIILKEISSNCKRVLETPRFIDVIEEIAESLSDFSEKAIVDVLNILLITISYDLEIREQLDPESVNEALNEIIDSESEASMLAKLLSEKINAEEEEENYENFADGLLM